MIPKSNIVIRALSAEYIRVMSKLHGAEKRLHHAEKQIEIESQLVFDAKNELVELLCVIESEGGTVPDDPAPPEEVAYQD